MSVGRGIKRPLAQVESLRESGRECVCDEFFARAGWA